MISSSNSNISAMRGRHRPSGRAPPYWTLLFVSALVAVTMLLPGGSMLLRRQSGLTPSLSTVADFQNLREELIGAPLDSCGAQREDQFGPDLRLFLAEYAKRHAAAVDKKGLGGGLMLYQCILGTTGGTGDQIKGMLTALMLSMLSPAPRAFLLLCDTLEPIETVWQPRSGSVDWRVRDSGLLRRARAMTHGESRGLLDLLTADFEFIQHLDFEFQALRAVERVLGELPDAANVVYTSNLLFPSQFNATKLAQLLGPRVPGEWWREQLQLRQPDSTTEQRLRWRELQQQHDAGSSVVRIDVTPHAGLCHLPPELRSMLLVGAGEGDHPHSCVGDAAAAQFASASPQSSCPAPSNPSLQLHRGMGAGNTNLPFQLLDWLISPSADTLRLVHRVTRGVYTPGSQYVVSIHVRTGLTKLGDPGRDGGTAAAAIAARCAVIAGDRLAAAHGVRPRVLWFVASDDASVAGMLRRLAANVSTFNLGNTFLSGGARPAVDVVTVPLADIVHVDKPDPLLSAASQRAAFIGAYVEHFLLSAAHAMVRSRSGFSETAQAWGRVPLVYQINVGSQECVDVSMVPGGSR